MSQKTLVILKPDCVERGLVGAVTARIENTGLRLVACKMSNLSESILKDHYSHLVDKPFFPSILEYMMSAPVMIQIWEGSNAVPIVRKNAGVTNPVEATPGSIRGDFATSIDHNIIHSSEDDDSAQIEIARFFNTNELVSYA